MAMLKSIVLFVAGFAALSPVAGLTGAVAAEPEGEVGHRLEAIVRVHAEVPAEARTAAFLGTARDGSGPTAGWPGSAP